MAIQRIDIGDFTGGVNTEKMPHEIGMNQASDILNMDLSVPGKIATRGGTAKLNSTEITNATGIYGAFYGKSKHIAASLTTVSYKNNGGFGADIKTGMTSNSETYFAEWDNYVWGVNGANAMWKWDGSTATAITDPHADFAASPLTYICKHDNRLWGLRAASSNLYWCKRGTGGGDYWNPVNDPDNAGKEPMSPNDGFTGTGIAGQRSGLLVFKQQGIYRVVGYTPVSFRFPCLYDTIGCIAPRSIAVIDNRVFFLSRHDGDYKVFVIDDGDGLHWLSEGITATLNTITAASASTAAAGVFGNKYILSFPVTGGWKTVELNYQTGAWEIGSGNSMRCYYQASNILYGGGTGNGYVYQLGTGTNDAGTKITNYIITRNYYMGAPEFKKSGRELWFWCKASGSYELNVNLYVDDKLLPGTYKIPLGTLGSTETVRVGKVKVPQELQGSMVKFKFGIDTLDQTFELYKAAFYYETDEPQIK